MNRVFDFVPAEHEVVVSRILVQLHQAVDDAFPHAESASPRFARTAFSGYDEPTLTQLSPGEAAKDELDDKGHKAPFAGGDDQLLSGDAEVNFNRGFFGKAALTQTLIGALALIVVALVAYFIFAN